jgi:catechol 2,3-dioxygenase-like lactoylglutathione lyase family enzyme
VLQSADLVAFIATRDLNAAGVFYGSTLRLPLLDVNGFARVYDANGTQLRVTLVESLAEAPYTVLGWRVEDIAQTIAELRAAGVQFKRYAGMDQDADCVWVAPGGTRVAWFSDPDGNTLSLQQEPGSSDVGVPGSLRAAAQSSH